MLKSVLDIAEIGVDILLCALVGQEVDEEEIKIYRVHFRDGTSRLVAARSGQGALQELAGVYAQRVSPKR